MSRTNGTRRPELEAGLTLDQPIAGPARQKSATGDRDAVVLAVAHRDTTDAVSAERQLEASLGQVRRLASHLQDVREQERRLIAREIHDELAHQLTALKIDVVSLERELQRVSSGLAASAASMKALLDQVIGSMRRLSTELRPGILDDFGLVAAIEWEAEAFEEQTGIITELVLEADDSGLAPPLQTAVFRILQESLSNVRRHARADHVEILLRREPAELRLEVRDNGTGFSAGKLDEPSCYGLTGMRERAIALGGAFRIDGRPGQGTTVAVALPLDRPGDGEPSHVERSASGPLPAVS
jgi:signal transduction histidine kinase